MAKSKLLEQYAADPTSIHPIKGTEGDESWEMPNPKLLAEADAIANAKTSGLKAGMNVIRNSFGRGRFRRGND